MVHSNLTVYQRKLRQLSYPRQRLHDTNFRGIRCNLRGSIFAPEHVESLTSETEKMSLLSPVSAMGETTLNGRGVSSPVSPRTPGASDQSSNRPEGRARSYSSVTSERKARLNAHTNGSHNLHPAMLPHLQTLILTDVPAYSTTKEAPERLIRFVKQCADEMQLANAQAKLDYSLPPGRKGHLSAIKHAAHKNFALRRIVLEIAPEEKPKTSNGGSRWRNVKNPMNEDRDVEALWSAAEADFSFFGEGEQATYPYLEYGRFADGLGSDQKEISVSCGSHPPQPQQQSHVEPDPKVDVISMLSTFRKDRKMAHQQKIDMGVHDSDTEGYWDGLMQVVRPAGDTRPDEEIDYYGNSNPYYVKPIIIHRLPSTALASGSPFSDADADADANAMYVRRWSVAPIVSRQDLS
ncbi:hypothetical protein KC330_g184 [Hortaea werneckii]|nr:hypothetical protein KC330_g184 [Hortaea werneckii]